MNFSLPKISIAFKATILLIAIVLSVVLGHYLILGDQYYDSLWKERRSKTELLLNSIGDNYKLQYLNQDSLTKFELNSSFIEAQEINSTFILSPKNIFLYHSNSDLINKENLSSEITKSLVERKFHRIKNKSDDVNYLTITQPIFSKEKLIGLVGIEVSDIQLKENLSAGFSNILVTVFFIIVVGVFLLFIVMSPIMHMMSVFTTGFTKFANEKKSDGSLLLTHRVQWNNNSELSYIVSLFNTMADKVEDAYRKATFVRGESIPLNKNILDEETGMLAGDFFQDDLKRLLKLSVSRDFPVTLLRFELVNGELLDEENHHSNLGLLAGAVFGNIRIRSDRVYRLDKNQFALVLSGTGRLIAEERAHAITQNYFSSRLDQKSFALFGIEEYNKEDSYEVYRASVEKELQFQKENYKEY